ncbi:hypothetical protein [Mucilaginibacter sp.]|uniref:hypothetical protein n=1 Tax=Mucilaginibacter sp. TaxID=1882438 RepID=UPI002ED3CE32
MMVPLSLFAQAKMPAWFYNSFRTLKLDQHYGISNFIKPSFLSADFNGDGSKDIAALIISKKNKKKGILIIHQTSHKYFVMGAGVNFGNGGDDFNWAKGWKLYKDKVVYETVFDKDDNISGSKKNNLKHPGVYIYDLMDGEPNSGGVISCNGEKYIWIHQGE